MFGNFFLQKYLYKKFNFYYMKVISLFDFMELIDENQVHIVKVGFTMEELLKEKVDKLSVIGQTLIKA